MHPSGVSFSSHNLDAEIALIKHGISNTPAAPSPHFHLLYFWSQTTEDREQEAHHRSENMVLYKSEVKGNTVA